MSISNQNDKSFNGTIIIGDPCEIVKSDEDWQLCEYGKHLDRLGFTDYLYIVSDEVAPIVKGDLGNILGSFCTDSGIVVVALLDELLKYNPTFDMHKHIYYKDNWTVIENFNGTVNYYENDENTYIEGKGNINFITVYEDDE
ncbi:MAG: hypothetical protein K2N47_02155 [Clostridia bacterium]|nr:hypothetical protein [Clostridia bacterium]